MPDPHELFLREFSPRPEVVTRTTRIDRPRFPVIDAHNHLGELLPGLRFSGDWPDRPVVELIDVMDESHVRLIVNLDGRSGENLRREIERYQEPHPTRFAVFCGIDYGVITTHADFGAHLARQLRADLSAGARGLKVWKPLGLTVRDVHGNLVAPNDPRLDELWSTAGELGVPVLIHVADPVAFFRPLDRFNERYEELRAHPEWHFHGPQFPTFDSLMESLADLVSRHRGTTFIGAHVGCYSENLDWVSNLLRRCPNLYVDIAARLAELGRVPHRARQFFLDHADRILFGTDFPPAVEMYRLHWRFLESSDEYFPYWLGDGPSPQGRWMIGGVDLPDDVLKQVHHDNAARVLRLTSAAP
jgi:hypothetical protein